jgi:glycosyltransferase involved in cell wall biosynthesis
MENLIEQASRFSKRIIVIDDCSDDGTAQFLSNWPMVTRVEHKFNFDFSEQRNIGLNLVNDGEWFFRVDSDEILTDKLASSISDTVNYLDSIDIDRVQIPIFHLINFSMCKTEIGIELRLFKKNSSCEYKGKTHEHPHGDFSGHSYQLPNHLGLIHFKYIDAEKITETETTYVEHDIYTKEDIERRKDMTACFLPLGVEFSLNDELKCYLTQNS